MQFDKDELLLIKPLCLITIKPIMFVANVDENGFENNTLLDEVKKFADKTKAPVVAVCAKIESEISDLNDDEK